MGISVQGIDLVRVSLSREDGKDKVNGEYVLMSNVGVALAKQSFGDGYGAMQHTPSPATIAARNAFLGCVKADFNHMLGLEAST